MTLSIGQLRVDVHDLVAIAREAGQAVLEVYSQDFRVDYKGDNSPLTLADCRSNQIIVAGLERLTPVGDPDRGRTDLSRYGVREDARPAPAAVAAGGPDVAAAADHRGGAHGPGARTRVAEQPGTELPADRLLG